MTSWREAMEAIGGEFGKSRTVKAGRRLGGFLGRHPAYLLAPVALAGIESTRPVRTISTAAGQSFAGDPDYFRKLTMGGLLGPMGSMWQGSQPGFGANIMSTGNTAGITTEGSNGLSVSPDPDQALRMSEQALGTNPSGSILFGLYNNRLR